MHRKASCIPVKTLVSDNDGMGIWRIVGRVAIIWTKTNIVFPKARSLRRAHFPTRLMTHLYMIQTKRSAPKKRPAPPNGARRLVHGWHAPVMLLKNVGAQSPPERRVVCACLSPVESARARARECARMFARVRMRVGVCCVQSGPTWPSSQSVFPAPTPPMHSSFRQFRISNEVRVVRQYPNGGVVRKFVPNHSSCHAQRHNAQRHDMPHPHHKKHHVGVERKRQG